MVVTVRLMAIEEKLALNCVDRLLDWRNAFGACPNMGGAT